MYHRSTKKSRRAARTCRVVAKYSHCVHGEAVRVHWQLCQEHSSKDDSGIRSRIKEQQVGQQLEQKLQQRTEGHVST
jgi:hypothetical protein